MRRDVDLVVLSDIHLGTRSCQAELLERYLDGIDPGEVILDGDIVDLRELRIGHWPDSHTRIARRFLAWAEAGVPVRYVIGNHDASLRRLGGCALGELRLCDRIERDIGGLRTLIVHGDAIELGMGTNRVLRRLGCWTFRGVRFADRVANWGLRRIGDRRLHLLRLLKRLGTRHIAAYDLACASYARAQGFDAIICGHIHRPRAQLYDLPGGSVLYLNSGDWVDSASSLEFTQGSWRVWRFLDAAGHEASPPMPVPA